MTLDAVLFANVGNTDLRLKDGALPASPPERGVDFRAVAERLLADPDWERVEFPLLAKYLAYVRLAELRLVRVVLVGTDQPATAPPQHRAKDTWPAAQLMQLWLGQLKPAVPCKLLRYTGDPTDWDALHDFFSRRLPAHVEPGARHLVGLTGGTQQMNSMLLLSALDQLPQVQPLAVSESRPQPSALGIGRKLAQRDLGRLVVSHVKHRDYHAALGLLQDVEDFPSDTQIRRFCLALLTYSHRRSCFRFGEAARALLDEMPAAPDEQARAAARSLVEEAAALEQADLAPGAGPPVETELLRLAEMARLARLANDRGQLLEIPGIVYTFTDVALRILSERLGVEVVGDRGERRLREAWVRARPDLLAALEEAGTRWQESYTAYVALAVVTGVAAGKDAAAEAAVSELQSLQGIVGIRHRSPLGHDTVGISPELLGQKYPGGAEAIVSCLRRVAERVSGRSDPDWFDQLEPLLSRLLLGR